MEITDRLYGRLATDAVQEIISKFGGNDFEVEDAHVVSKIIAFLEWEKESKS